MVVHTGDDDEPLAKKVVVETNFIFTVKEFQFHAIFKLEIRNGLSF